MHPHWMDVLDISSVLWWNLLRCTFVSDLEDVKIVTETDMEVGQNALILSMIF